MPRYRILISSFIFAFMYAASASAADDIVIGMVNALSGPAAGLGTGVTTGSSVYFDRINAEGGIHGAKIRVVSYDDGYEPDNTVAMTKKLLADDKPLVLFGFVGTPTSKVAVPLAEKAKTPFVAPMTGADFLRDPVKPWVFNVRGSYVDETDGLVEHFKADLGLTKIGVFIQDDAYGEAGKAAVVKALEKRGLQLAGEGRFTRNTVDVDAGLEALRKSEPEIIIMVGAYNACAEFVKKARSVGFTPKLASLSFVGTANFMAESGMAGDGVYISQVMPPPKDGSIAIVKQYQTDMRAAGKKPDYTSLEGYVSAAVLVEALRKAGPNPSRKALRKALEQLDFDVGGLHVKFSKSDHQGLEEIYFTQVRGGVADPVSKF